MALDNQMFPSKTIFRSTKESIQCIDNLTNMNPTKVDSVAYQEIINQLLVGVAKEKEEENNLFYEGYKTSAELAKIDVQIRISNPTTNKGH